MDLFLGFVAASAWGINNVYVAKISRGNGPLVTGLAVQTFGLILTVLILVLFSPFHLPTHASLALLVSGILSGIFYYVFCLALTKGQASIVVPIETTWIIFASIWGVLFFHEPLTLIKIIALPIVFLGIIVLSLDWQKVGRLSREKLLPGAILAIILAVGLSTTQFLNTVGTREIGAMSTVTIVRAITVATLLALIIPSRRNLSLNKAFLKNTLAAGVVDVVAFTSFNLAVVTGQLSSVSLMQGLTPVISIAAAMIFLNEKLSSVQKLAAIGTIAGVCLFQI